MTKPGNLRALSFIFTGISAVLLSIFTYTANGNPFRFGIDPSWHYGLNYFFNENLQLGSQVHFTYGPLGFLMFSLPMGNNLLIASCFWFITRCILAALLIHLLSRSLSKTNLSNILVSGLGLILFLSLMNVHLLFFLNLSLILCYSFDKKNSGYVLAACFISILTFLIKPGLGIYNFLVLYFYFLIHRNWRYLLLITLANILMYFTLWLFFYHNLSGSIGFLHSSWEFISGFNQAMSIIQPNSLAYIFLSLFFLFLTGLAFLPDRALSQQVGKKWHWKDRVSGINARGLIAFLITLPAILFCYKFSYSREDQHIYLILNFTILCYLFWWLLLNSWSARLILLLCGFFCCLFLYLNQLQVGYAALPLQINLGINNFYQEIIHPQKYKAELQHQSQLKFSKIDLAVEKFLDVKNRSFDIYPYHTALLAAKNLRWQPRPVMQSYTSYTAYLDNLNAAFIDTQKAADYIIWHDADTLTEIDQRYLLNSEPNTSFALLNYYQAVGSYKNFVFFKKISNPRFTSLHPFSHQSIKWNQWLAIPKNNYSLIRAKIFLQQNIYQKFSSLFYPPQVKIDYLLSNQTVLSYPLIVATAKNGIWIRPLLQSLTNSLTPINLADFPDIPRQQVDYQLDKPEFRNGFLLISGWALVKNFNPQTTQLTIILANKNHAYAFRPEPNTRKEVIHRFPAIISNPQFSGFLAKLNLAEIPEGEYHLFLGMIYRNKPGVFGPLATFKIDELNKNRSETVTTIRLRQSNHAYGEDISLQWLGGEILKPLGSLLNTPS